MVPPQRLPPTAPTAGPPAQAVSYLYRPGHLQHRPGSRRRRDLRHQTRMATFNGTATTASQTVPTAGPPVQGTQNRRWLGHLPDRLRRPATADLRHETQRRPSVVPPRRLHDGTTAGPRAQGETKSAVAGTSTGPSSAAARDPYGIKPNGDLQWYRHDGCKTAPTAGPPVQGETKSPVAGTSTGPSSAAATG